jgi:MinD-like ATPase involved in chromosome partitioning or flagellar assembly
MIINVTGVSKGTGQSITAINIVSLLSQLSSDKNLLFDLNRYCTDVAYYLSNSPLTKGLDDLLMIKDTTLLTKQKLIETSKVVKENMNILGSNETFDVTEVELKDILALASKEFKHIVIDSIASLTHTTKIMLDIADVNVVVLNQYRKNIDKITEHKLYDKYKEKTIYVINKYDKRINYNKKNIAKDLGVDEENILTLEYEPEIVNSTNNNTILNYSFKENENSEYATELNDIVNKILELTGEPIKVEEKPRRGLFGIFGMGR